MCTFCHRHGEGRKWYLNAKNYAEDLLSDVRRRAFIAEFFSRPERLARDEHDLRRLDEAPAFVRRLVHWGAARRQRAYHWGQVVPIEDLARILEFAGSVTRLACICRHARGQRDARYCYGISVRPDGGEMRRILLSLDGSLFSGPDPAGLETLAKEEALTQFRAHEREGLCHTVWTFVTPFIGGICSCDRADCMAMRATVTHGYPVMFRAEYVAAVDAGLCAGCRGCMRVCPFGAISFAAARRKAEIDPRRCYGCGVCRAACKKNAIRLLDRRESPVAARLW